MVAFFKSLETQSRFRSRLAFPAVSHSIELPLSIFSALTLIVSHQGEMCRDSNRSTLLARHNHWSIKSVYLTTLVLLAFSAYLHLNVIQDQ